MSANGKSGKNGVPGPFRVRLRYRDVETFIEKYTPNVSRGGIFLATKSPRHVGEVFRFEMLLADGRPVLAGEGKVTWIKDADPDDPGKPHGMGVQFVRVDKGSRAVLEEIIRRKNGARPRRVREETPTDPMAVRLPHEQAAVPRGSIPAADLATDPATTFGVDEASIRRAIERARHVTARYEDLDALAAPDPVEPVTLSRALLELGRLTGRR